VQQYALAMEYGRIWANNIYLTQFYMVGLGYDIFVSFDILHVSRSFEIKFLSRSFDILSLTCD